MYSFKRIFIFITITVLFVNSFAQKIIIPKKSMYTSQDEKLYINKALPLYLRIATSPNPNAETHLLKSKISSKYSNPMYLDTEGYNSIHSPSAVDTVTKQTIYPLQNIIFEVYADSKNPITKVYYGKVLTVYKEGKTFCGGLTELTLTARDAMSGVSKIYYSLDSSAFLEYKEPIKLKKEGEYFLQYYSVDNVGNMEKLKISKIVLDASNPATKLEVKGDLYNNILSGRSTINLIAADQHGIKAIYYSLDEHPEKVYARPISALYIRQGEHTLKYYSIDQLGNIEIKKSYSFYVDKTAPRIVEDIIGNTYVANGKEYSSGRTKFKLITIDNKAGVKEVFYSINGGEYKKYDKPFYLSDNSGSIVVKSYALDFVNNKSTSVQNSDGTDIPYIDLSGPILNYNFKGSLFQSNDTTFISQNTKIILYAKDYASGVNKVEYSINGKLSKEYTEPFNIKKEGSSNIKIMAYDNVDNTNSKSINIVVDNTDPELFNRFSVVAELGSNETKSQQNVYPNYVVLFVSATDKLSGYDRMFYSINGLPEIECFGAIRDFKSGKDYSITLRAIDKLGNENKDNINFTIK